MVSLKDTGSGKIELFKAGEKVEGLYLQETSWQELTNEAQDLKVILVKSM